MNMRNRGPIAGQGQQPPPAGMMRDPNLMMMPRYAKEVHDLMEEIMQMREAKWRLENEIAKLMRMKSEQSSRGEYAPPWMGMPDPVAALPPPPPAEPEAPPEFKGSAWRAVVRPVPRQKKKHGAPGTPKAITAGPMIPASPPPPPQQPAWAQWRPNPNIVPQPRTPAPAPVVVPPKNDGLFGPED